ncbi:MAG: kinase [Desulfobacterales bacterium]|nr:MAG: kinase [Desulfobacterales bacterium]
MIISHTPHRISFFGGGTDYPSYYLRHGGKVLGAAIDKYCYLSVRKLPPFFEHRHRIVYSNQELVSQIDEIQHPSVRWTLDYLKVNYGVSIHHDGDIPARSGMGSSSAFTVGLLNSLNALNGLYSCKKDLVENAIYIEQELIKEHVGSQDQTFAAYGGFNVIEFAQNGKITVAPMITEEKRLNLFERHLMLFYTGISRIASEIAEEQIQKTGENVEVLHEMKKMVGEAVEIICSNRPLKDFGELLDYNWHLKKNLSAKITTPEIDAMYQLAKKAGAIGGKVCGAGGGGFVLLFVEPEKRQAVKKTLKRFLHVPFHFDFEGSKIIVYRPETQNGNGY